MSFKPTNGLHKVDLTLNLDYAHLETKTRKPKLGHAPVTNRSSSLYSREKNSLEGNDSQ